MKISFKSILIAIALIVLIILGSSLVYIKTIQPFLAISAPIQGDIWIIEGWLPGDAILRAADYIAEKEYHLVITSGIPIEPGSLLSNYKTFANAAKIVISEKYPQQRIIAVSAPALIKDRTYNAMLSVHNWLKENGITDKRINLISFDVHARRSWFLAEKAFGSEYTIGILAIDDATYDERRWWASSSGFKAVINESIAYLYTILFFNCADDLLDKGI